jgi:hypothetical protein
MQDLSNKSLFPQTDQPNQEYLNWKTDNKDIYKDVILPKNVLSGKWLYLEDMRIGVMTDDKFHVSTYGEMVDAKEEYLIEMIKKKDIMPLIIDIQRLIETVVWANVDEGNYAIEAKIRKEINNWDEIYFTLWKHIGGTSFANDYEKLINNRLP